MKFLDRAKIHVRAGSGGDGSVSFLREKNRPRGGPDGGDGGRGGDVVLVASDALTTLIDFRHQQHIRARRGGHGRGANRTGASGETLDVTVPVGTQVRADDDAETLLADLTAPGQRLVLARGGRGGRGNAQFKSATNQAPRTAEPGETTTEFAVWLQLKLLADIGVVGLPNAGKSTFLSAVTRARPRVADYPFTTLHPHLGVVRRGGEEMVLADIPGLIEGAHTGHGLGDRFLAHVERCSGLLHLVDATGDDPVAAYQAVRAELAGYGGDLAAKPEWVALTKADALPAADMAALAATLGEAAGQRVTGLSAAAGTGLDAVLPALMAHATAARTARTDQDDGEARPAWSPV